MEANEQIKEKAAELLEMFIKPVDELHNYPMCFDTAKQSALIAVKLVLSTDLYSPQDRYFWFNVYKELVYYEKR